MRKWVRDDEGERAQGVTGATINVAPAFVPVVTHAEVDHPVEAAVELSAMARREDAAPPAQRAPARLRAQLPNGVTLELECGGRDGALVKAMIEALGAH